MLQAIAIDDEPAALEIIQRMAAKVPFVQLQAVFLSGLEALVYCRQTQIDIIFLDIEMPDMNGTELARIIGRSTSQIIFTTAYAEHAVEGFALQATDYLLKPIEFSRFLTACNRVLERKTDNPLSIFVKDGYNWVKVNLQDVLYIESEGNLLFIHEQTRKIVTRMTITDMLTQLPTSMFLRIHKSYIVALSAIEKIEKHQVTIGKQVIPLAANYREQLENRLLKK